MKYITINGHTIRKNITAEQIGPPIRIAKSKSDAHPVYASEVEIIGPARLIYDAKAAIVRCGARMVLQCADAKVIR